jgi:hypothetical protein
VDRIKRDKAAADAERKKQDDERAKNTKPTLEIAKYAGIYSDQLYGDITIAEENGRLVMRFSHSPNFVADLEHWHYDTFEIKWRPPSLTISPAGSSHSRSIRPVRPTN